MEQFWSATQEGYAFSVWPDRGLMQYWLLKRGWSLVGRPHLGAKSRSMMELPGVMVMGPRVAL